MADFDVGPICRKNLYSDLMYVVLRYNSALSKEFDFMLLLGTLI